MECLRLRVKDIDFGNHEIIVRDGKGEDDRATILPDSLIPTLQLHLKNVQLIHQRDLKDGFGEVYLPYALAKKYPGAPKDWIWQYLFPASVRSIDPVSKKTMQHHADPGVLQKTIRQAAKLAQIDKPVTPPYLPPLLRHPPPPKRLRHPHRPACPSRRPGEFLGHKDVKTTMIYIHVLQRGGLAVKSPLDT